jgi:hypothetical protein
MYFYFRISVQLTRVAAETCVGLIEQQYENKSAFVG